MTGCVRESCLSGDTRTLPSGSNVSKVYPRKSWDRRDGTTPLILGKEKYGENVSIVSCKTLENVRQKFVTEGFDASLNRKKRDTPARAKLLNGEQEARVIALSLGKPAKGYANWSLRLLAEKVVELEIVESISYETVRRTLKKTV